MADTGCRVMFRGGTLKGFVKEEVFVTFASMMKKPIYYVEPYFSGHTVCLKSGMSRERADLVHDSLRRLGMDVWVECDEEAPRQEKSTPPETGEPVRAEAGEQERPAVPEAFGESLVKALLASDASSPRQTSKIPSRSRSGQDRTSRTQDSPPAAATTRDVPRAVDRVSMPVSEHCSFKAFLLITLFSLLGGGVGTAVVYLIKFSLFPHSPILTVLFIWSGTLLGVRIGDRLGGHCGKPHIVMLAVSPIGLILFGVSFFQTFLYLMESERSVVWGVLESVCLFATPVLAVIVVRGRKFCPACRKAYRERQLFADEQASPEKVLAFLNKGMVPENAEQVAADTTHPQSSRQLEVSVESTFCPSCRQSVVEGVLAHRDEKGREQETVFFSRKWSAPQAVPEEQES